MSTLELAHRFIQFIIDGDVEGAKSCQHDDAAVWHNYDNSTQSVGENMRLMEYMMAKCKKREYELHRLEEIEGGYLQHHTLKITAMNGKVYSTEAIAIVTVVNGKISRIQEWLDPAQIAPAFQGA